MKVRHQLLLALTLTCLLTATLIAAGSGPLLHETVRERYVDRIRSETGLLAWWLASTDGIDPQTAATGSATRLGMRVTLMQADGTVLADSARTPAGVASMDNHAGRPEVRAALDSGSGESERRSATVGERYYYRAVRVEGSGPVDLVRVALPISEIEATQTRLIQLAVLVSLAVLGILVVISYATVRRLSRRIERVADAAERTSQGDLTVEMDVPGEDEIGRLASSLHRMKQNLLVQIGDVENERQLLSSIVSGIQEGLILVGHDRRVRTANEAFRRIFQVPFDPDGRLLAEVVRFPSVIHRLEDVLAGGPDIREMVVRSPDTGRSFELHATPVTPDRSTGERWVLALFFDITRLEALENVRQEFVANVSHELRTPLTSIRAFVETLLEGGMEDEANREKFLQVIQRQSNHMQELIDDLTDLSRIETGAIALERESIDVAEVAQDVLARVRDRHPEADVELRTGFDEPVRGRFDRRRMEQILVNLVENAVKFNRPGGHVTVGGRRNGAGIVVEVEDDGIGIPSESLPKIFNRFYRVDKARSKEVPGTGLGLAIVKHLVRLHGGTIRVRSELGRGATFTMEFPTGPTAID